MLKELDSQRKSCEDLLRMVKDELAEMQANESIREVDQLEATHRVELEAKEREIEHGKQMLKELDDRWKSQMDLLFMVKDELAERQVNELLRKVDKLKVTHRIEIEAKEREIRGLKQHLEDVDSWWKSRDDLFGMTNDELAERQVNELLRKVDELEAPHKVELEANEREVRGLKRHLEELDNLWKSQNDLLCMVKDELAGRQVNELLRKVDKLKATHRIELEAKEREIRGIKRHLEDLESWWKSHDDLFGFTNDELAERQVNELLRKVDELEVPHKVELEAKEREIRGLKQHLEDLESWWKSRDDLFGMTNDELAERQVNELLRKVDELESPHKVELEVKEREIKGLKRHLEELDNLWKSQKDLLFMVKDELAGRQVNELLRRVDKLKTTHRIELEAKEREIRGLKQHLEDLESWWKSRDDLFGMTNDELAERQVNELLRKVDELEAPHKVEFEAKETEIRGLKRHLEELDKLWKSQNDLLCMVKDELAGRQVNELLRKVEKLKATHGIELEAKEREIRGLKQHLEDLESWWKSRDDLFGMTNDELAKRQVNELLKKVDELEAPHKVELEPKEREIRSLKRHLEELDNLWKSQTDLFCMVKDELAERKVNELLRKVNKLKTTRRIELEAKEKEIRGLKRHLEELDSWWKNREDLFFMTNDELAERQVNELLKKVDKLEATHKIELKAKEREIRGLKRYLEELDNRWKSQKDLLFMAKGELAERQVNELITNVSEWENFQRLIDENEQAGGSSSVNANN